MHTSEKLGIVRERSGPTFEAGNDQLIDAAECKKRHPLIETHDILGALWDPLDGDIDPAQLCQSLARRARLAGAEIYRHTPVTGLRQKANGEWRR